MELTLEERNELRQLMNKHLNMDAVLELAEELGIDPENLAGSTKSAKVRELIGHAERHLLMESLITALVQRHGKVAWPRKTAVSQATVTEEPVVVKPAEGCDITAVSAHLGTITTLDPTQQFGLAQRLLATPTMGNAQSRQNVIALLPAQIRNSLLPGTTGTLEIVNLITTCLNYANGLSTLVHLIYLVEEESESMKALCQFALTLKNTG